jgi:hypothetical protein
MHLMPGQRSTMRVSMAGEPGPGSCCLYAPPGACTPQAMQHACVRARPPGRRDVRDVVEGPPCQLLERVAHIACERVLANHARVLAVRLLVRKLSIPGVPSCVDSVGEVREGGRGGLGRNVCECVGGWVGQRRGRAPYAC